MDIKNKISKEDKALLSNLGVEIRVLESLLGERRSIMGAKANEILASNGLSPEAFGLNFNPGLDRWEAVLKNDALVIPGQEVIKNIGKRRN